MPTLHESPEPMVRTPKGLRLAIGIFGRRNAGKSSLLNALVEQDASIVSPVAGTTTDPVEKPMELHPLGPVLFIDTAGVDDTADGLGALRTQRSAAALERCDVALLVVAAGTWGEYETELARAFAKRGIATIVVFNRTDECTGGPDAWTAALPAEFAELPRVFTCAVDGSGLAEVRTALLEAAPDEFVDAPVLVADMVDAGSVVVLVTPQDKEAPRGRLILPQVQTIRDLLDGGCLPLCVRTEELPGALAALREPPALVITDSQAFGEVARLVPENVPLTSFSIVFARNKGNLAVQAAGTRAIENLTGQSRVLIAEACTHHAIEDDIATVKIPRLLRARAGEGLGIENVRGMDFPANLGEYDLVIHCGGCMFNRRQVLSRIQRCVEAGVPISNYGLTLAYLNGIFERALAPFIED